MMKFPEFFRLMANHWFEVPFFGEIKDAAMEGYTSTVIVREDPSHHDVETLRNQGFFVVVNEHVFGDGEPEFWITVDWAE